MVGICGSIGAVDHGVDAIRDAAVHLNDVDHAVYKSDDAEVVVTHHEHDDEPQPIELSDGALLWLWGVVYGRESADGYVSRIKEGSEDGSAAWVGQYYDIDGPDVLADLNGEFVGLVLHPDRGTATFFTDRLGSRPLYWAWVEDGLVFASQIQALVAHPDIETGFVPEYVYEYLTFNRVLGTKTPFEDVMLLPPGTQTTIDTGNRSVSRQRYWAPEYRPVDMPYEEYVDELAATFKTVLAERVGEDATYGVMLSGGSDSRMVLGALDDARDVEAFHMAEWDNREASVARRVAETVGASFTLLERDATYQHRALAENPSLSNFVSQFNQAHATGFLDEIDAKVDVLLSGQFCDTFFKGHFLPVRNQSLGPVGSVDLPIRHKIDTVEDYRAYLRASMGEPPAFVADEAAFERIVEDNVVETDEGLCNHGVTYPSVRDCYLFGNYYPLTNQPDYFWYESLVHMLPHRSPFLDNRLLDLHLRIPTRYYLRKNIVNSVVQSYDRSLADLPHGTSGLPLWMPEIAHFLGEHVHLLCWKYNLYLPWNRPPSPESGHKPWTDHRSLIRTDDFVGRALEANEALVRALPFLDFDGAMQWYEDHREKRANNTADLYRLVTFLAMPVIEHVVSAPSGSAGGPGEADQTVDGGDNQDRT